MGSPYFTTHALAKEHFYEYIYSKTYAGSASDVFVDVDPGAPYPTGGEPTPPDDNELTPVFATDALCREQVAKWMHNFMTGGEDPDHSWEDPDSSPEDGPTDPSPPDDPASLYEMETWVLMMKSRIVYRTVDSNNKDATWSNMKGYVLDMTKFLLAGVRIANGATS